MATTDKKPERSPDRSYTANLERMREQARQARSKCILAGDEEKADKVKALIDGIDELLGSGRAAV